MDAITRRSFLAGTAASATMLHASGANDRIRLGIVGAGGRGSYLMGVANQVGGIQWVAVCDAWDQRRAKAARELAGGGDVAQFGDYRRLLDRKDIDAVIVATWDHLHSEIAAEACKAGKDVYVEKPMTSLPMQGHPLVRAVRENKRVLQVGTQQRSMANFIEAKQKFIDSGLIGEVNMVRTVWNGNSGYLTPVPPGMERKPDGLDWDACLGWLPKIPWDPKRYFNRFAYWDFSTGGQTGGLFVHMVDVVHWYLNVKKPVSAVAGGGIYQYNDGRDAPDNINFILEYPQKLNVTFESTITDMSEDYADIVFMGTGGRLSIFRSGYTFTPGKANKAMGVQKGGRAPETTHMANWLECIRSRKDPAVPVEEGHYSAMACHIGNIAYREKRVVKWQSEWDL
jgi:predicted dehydrogenase